MLRRELESLRQTAIDSPSKLQSQSQSNNKSSKELDGQWAKKLEELSEQHLAVSLCLLF